MILYRAALSFKEAWRGQRNGSTVTSQSATKINQNSGSCDGITPFRNITWGAALQKGPDDKLNVSHQHNLAVKGL